MGVGPGPITVVVSRGGSLCRGAGLGQGVRPLGPNPQVVIDVRLRRGHVINESLGLKDGGRPGCRVGDIEI